MLLKIDDPAVAHEYWKAGLLVNSSGNPWSRWVYYLDNPHYMDATGDAFLGVMYEAFIYVEA